VVFRYECPARSDFCGGRRAGQRYTERPERSLLLSIRKAITFRADVIVTRVRTVDPPAARPGFARSSRTMIEPADLVVRERPTRTPPKPSGRADTTTLRAMLLGHLTEDRDLAPRRVPLSPPGTARGTDLFGDSSHLPSNNSQSKGALSQVGVETR
jgi:hypothetical protein